MEKIPFNRKRKIRTWQHSNEAALLDGINASYNKISLIDLASNDYLGLNTDPRIIDAANLAMNSNGVGSGGSHLVTGSRPIHKELESALSKWLGREHVLLFPSGFQANLAAVIALANRKTLVIADKLIHYSLLVGIKASGAKLKRFAHNDLNELEKALKLSEHENTLVITESLFSMEGTNPELKPIATLCKKFGASLFVDEAHALGIMGPEGRGLCYELSDSIKMISGTFGKAFGGGGAFLATNKVFGEHLIQTSGPFRYTTALAPPLAAAALEALKIIQENPFWGKELIKKANNWREKIASKGWGYAPGNGPILSIIIGTDEESLYYQNKLEKNGLLGVAIRPPTVPEGTSRLRIVVRRDLPNESLEKLIFCLGRK